MFSVQHARLGQSIEGMKTSFVGLRLFARDRLHSRDVMSQIMINVFSEIKMLQNYLL